MNVERWKRLKFRKREQETDVSVYHRVLRRQAKKWVPCPFEGVPRLGQRLLAILRDMCRDSSLTMDANILFRGSRSDRSQLRTRGGYREHIVSVAYKFQTQYERHRRFLITHFLLVLAERYVTINELPSYSNGQYTTSNCTLFLSPPSYVCGNSGIRFSASGSRLGTRPKALNLRQERTPGR